MKTDGSDMNAKGRVPINLVDEDVAQKTLKSQLAGMAREFERALPGKIGVDRMMRIAMTAILKTPQLAHCEPNSFFGALLQALQLGLEVNTPLGQAYLIPRRKKDRNGGNSVWECNFQLGYQGLLDLCYRCGKYKRITAEIVYEGDTFDYRYGTEQYLTHIPQGISENPIYVWALYELENTGSRFVVWSWEKSVKHGEEFSDAFNREKPWASPWLAHATTGEEMAKKSVLKALLKYAPKSVELAEASYVDEGVIVAKKVEDLKGSHLHFDLRQEQMNLKQLKAPNQEAKNFMDTVNSGQKSSKEVAAVVTPIDTTMKVTEEFKRTDSDPDDAVKSDVLFMRDEEATLDELWERNNGSVLPPDFD